MSEETGLRAINEGVDDRSALARHEQRTRAWVAKASIVMFLLTLAGLFILIVLDVPSELIALWLTALSTVAAFMLAATNLSRSGSGEDPPR